jgi:hypothetical protein
VAARTAQCWSVPPDRNLACRISLCLSIALLTPSPGHAQFRVDAWTTENGLPSNWVRALTQTRDGYLWLTTQDGLVRFDGMRFRVFNKSAQSRAKDHAANQPLSIRGSVREMDRRRSAMPRAVRPKTYIQGEPNA